MEADSHSGGAGIWSQNAEEEKEQEEEEGTSQVVGLSGPPMWTVIATDHSTIFKSPMQISRQERLCFTHPRDEHICAYVKQTNK